MTPDRRKADRRAAGRLGGRREHDVRPDGSVQDRENVRAWLDSMAPPPRVYVARLSSMDPELQMKGHAA